MLVIMMCLALDHEETERHCLKAANGCLSCDCPEDEFASWSRRPGAPKLVEEVIDKIRDASNEFIEVDGSIKKGAWAKSRPGKRRTESSYTGTTGSM
jgi:hypothetical protein